MSRNATFAPGALASSSGALWRDAGQRDAKPPSGAGLPASGASLPVAAEVPEADVLVVPRPRLAREMDDDALVAALVETEAISRRVEALRTALAAEAAERSRPELGREGLAARLGCRNAVELVQRTTGAAVTSVNRRIRLGAATRSGIGLTGEAVQPRFPAVARALEEGTLGVDAAGAIVDTLAPAARVAGLADIQVAEAAIVEGAVAPVPDDAPALDADSIRVQARVWRAVLDPDGTAPSEVDLERRGLVLGDVRHGLVPVRGMLLPEVAGALRRYADAWTNPRTPDVPPPTTTTGGPTTIGSPTTTEHAAPCDSFAPGESAALGESATSGEGARSGESATPRDSATSGKNAAPGESAMPCESVPLSDGALPGESATPLVGAAPAAGGGVADPSGPVPDGDSIAIDRRSRAQQMHDVLANALAVAARAAGAPSVAGNAPTLVVTARREDLVSGTGMAWVEGLPVNVAAARQVACAGAVETVIQGASGRIVGLRSSQRCFTGPQRRAIAVRDGTCVIPGCHVPAGWCEIHHVIAHAHDPDGTHTDNGVLLCWFHHRTLDTSGWQIRMRDGQPQVRPPGWLDPERRWRPTR